MKTVFVVLPLVMVVSCRPASQNSTISDDKLQAVYAALLEEGDRHRATGADSSSHFSADSVFLAFDISEPEFRSAIAEYRKEPARWQIFFEGAAKKLEEKRNTRVKGPTE